MSRRTTTLILAGAVIGLVFAPALTANARGGFSGGRSFSGGDRSAPTSMHTSGDTHYGTTPGGTHYAAGPNGAAEAGHGQYSSVNSNGYHNSGSYGTTANGTHYATGNNGAVAANDGHYATASDDGYHGATVNSVNVDNGWNAYGYAGYHPAAVATAAAVTTAAVIGARAYALPAGCVAYTYSTAYYNCGGAWYQPQYEGSSVVYVVVGQPVQ
jgi:hypothetical protein